MQSADNQTDSQPDMGGAAAAAASDPVQSHIELFHVNSSALGGYMEWLAGKSIVVVGRDEQSSK